MASCHSRITVFVDTPRTSAVSSLRQAAEESHFHDLALTLIDDRERAQRIVERDEIASRRDRRLLLVQRFVRRPRHAASDTGERVRSRRGSAALGALTRQRSGCGLATQRVVPPSIGGSTRSRVRSPAACGRDAPGACTRAPTRESSAWTSGVNSANAASSPWRQALSNPVMRRDEAVIARQFLLASILRVGMAESAKDPKPQLPIVVSVLSVRSRLSQMRGCKEG